MLPANWPGVNQKGKFGTSLSWNSAWILRKEQWGSCRVTLWTQTTSHSKEAWQHCSFWWINVQRPPPRLARVSGIRIYDTYLVMWSMLRIFRHSLSVWLRLRFQPKNYTITYPTVHMTLNKSINKVWNKHLTNQLVHDTPFESINKEYKVKIQKKVVLGST